MNKQRLIIIALLVLSGSWFFWQRPKAPQAESQIRSVSALEFDQLLSQPETFVLDVHIPQQEHLPGTDAFIPYNQLEQSLAQLPMDKNTPIAVYCRSGSMSREASQTLQQLGYTQVYDLIGGINAYRETHVSVSLTPAVQDLGTVIYGDVAETEFTLTNSTAAPLELTRVATSCGCTKAAAAATTLAPYETTTIEVTFDPAVHKDDTDMGEVSRIIYIDTDNPNFEHLMAEIRAVVIKK